MEDIDKPVKIRSIVYTAVELYGLEEKDIPDLVQELHLRLGSPIFEKLEPRTKKHTHIVLK